MIEADIESIVNLIKPLPGQSKTALPDRFILGVPLLKLHQFGAALLLNGFLFLGGIRSGPVKPEQFLQRLGFQALFIDAFLPRPGHHPELGSPVADMVVFDDRVSHLGRHARKTLANNGRANMPHVHRLGDVGR